MNEKITFKELIEELASKTEITQTQSQEFVNQLTELVLKTSIEEGKASITNFGSFGVVQVSERNGVSPQNGETIVIPSHKRLSFTPFKALEKKVNAPFEELEATIIEDESEEKVGKKSESTEKKASSINISNLIGIGIILIAIIFGAWYFLVRDTVSYSVEEEVANTITETPSEPQESITEENEILESIEPSVTEIQPTVTENVSSQEVEATPVVKENISSPTQVGKYAVTSGEWIFDIARKSYGRTTFWPLIFEANFSKSDDPDRLNSMIELTIPTIEDIKNPTSSDRERLAKAAQFVSDAYANVGKKDKAEAYTRVVVRFSN